MQPCLDMTALRFLGNLILFLIPAALLSLSSARLSRASREEWQLLAWVPVLPLLLWGVYIAVGTTRDPTSHNLWPFELVFWGLASLLLLGLFLAARRIWGRASDDRVPHRDRDRGA